jgi:Uracil DNA glycosylase superfamily
VRAQVGLKDAGATKRIIPSPSATGKSKELLDVFEESLAVRDCAICEAVLPLGARPVLQVASSARLLIISQAPGKKVHETGIAWNDASGERLRDWLGLDRPVFYDETRAAILPMGFCYPVRYGNASACPPELLSSLARNPREAPHRVAGDIDVPSLLIKREARILKTYRTEKWPLQDIRLSDERKRGLHE